MTGSILSRKFKRRKTKEWERVDLDNEDEERRRAVAGNAKKYDPHSQASPGITPDLHVSASSLSSRSTHVTTAHSLGGIGYSLFSPPQVTASNGAFPATVEIKQEFKQKPSEGMEHQAETKEEEPTTKTYDEPPLDMSLDQASWVGRQQMVKEFVKSKLFGQMKFVNKLRDEVFDMQTNTVCGKLLQHCWQGRDFTKQATVDAVKAWWDTVGQKLTFETVTNTRNNVIKNIKCAYMGKFTDTLALFDLILEMC